ncbi:hypothetical protein HYDPIDRAFT_114474 [Hydnomerulius pinastri MD-312]|uniref:Uncharacterized protein n=1 Tax=Hydnomerulius pinastri MD-312 TaxID=994086 RepID=A0A0C9WDD4_9AGAM|nr:hypothetical protein HYDPIDRAFT_114474 [Hydnomerulius pinastri MD-312]
MSTTLHNEFQKLEVSDGVQQNQPPQPVTRPKRLQRPSNGPKVPMPLRLPSDNGRVQFYGRPITEKFLRDYAIRYMPPEKLARSPDFLVPDHGVVLLSWYSRIHLMIEGVISPPVACRRITCSKTEQCRFFMCAPTSVIALDRGQLRRMWITWRSSW